VDADVGDVPAWSDEVGGEFEGGRGAETNAFIMTSTDP
jgi:hypothetical protein